jgi:phosphoglycolate phosphatase
MYASRDRLVIFDADGTLIDSFHAVELSFARHGMDIGDLKRFQRRRKLLKYLGGLREFPKNLRRQLDKDNRKGLKHTLTDIYRAEAQLFPGAAALLQHLLDQPDIRVGIISRNVTVEPEETLRVVLERHDIVAEQLDFIHCIPLGDEKTPQFRAIRQRFGINPARAFACGDEYRDYAAAIESGMHPLIVSYGFEDHARLTDDYAVPDEVIARTPEELATRLRHALDLDEPPGSA